MNNLKISWVIIMAIFSSFFFVACENDDDTENKIDYIIPIKTGNNWTYSTYYSHDKKITESTTFEIGDLVSIKGTEGYKYTTEGSSTNIVFLVKNDEEGNYVLVGGYSDVDTLVNPSIAYKLNANKGDNWTFFDIIMHEDYSFESRSSTMFCTNSDTLITTPKGTFNCIAFEYSPNSGEDVFKSYITKNIGIVKNEHYELGSLFSYQILTNYSLK